MAAMHDGLRSAPSMWYKKSWWKYCHWSRLSPTPPPGARGGCGGSVSIDSCDIAGSTPTQVSICCVCCYQLLGWGGRSIHWSGRAARALDLAWSTMPRMVGLRESVRARRLTAPRASRPAPAPAPHAHQPRARTAAILDRRSQNVFNEEQPRADADPNTDVEIDAVSDSDLEDNGVRRLPSLPFFPPLHYSRPFVTRLSHAVRLRHAPIVCVSRRRIARGRHAQRRGGAHDGSDRGWRRHGTRQHLTYRLERPAAQAKGAVCFGN